MQFPEASVCTSITESKRDLILNVPRAFFLKHSSSHSDSIPLFAHGSKSDACVGFSVVFPYFCRRCRIPTVALVFAGELSAVVLALGIIFTLPVDSYYF